MTNAIDTCTAQIVDLTDKTVCIQHGLSGKQALMDSARAYVTYHGAIEEWFEHMGMPQSTGYRYKSQLLKEGSFKYLQEKPKSENAEAVKSRKRREKGSNSHTEKKTPTDDSSSPSNSLLSSDTSNNDSNAVVRNAHVQQSDGVRTEFKALPPLPSGVVSFTKECDPGSLSMGLETYSPNDAVEQDLNECRRLLARLREINRKHCSVTTPACDRFSERDWEELDQEYSLLQGIASMRWERLREQVQQETRAASRVLTYQIGSAAGYSDDEVRGFLR